MVARLEFRRGEAVLADELKGNRTEGGLKAWGRFRQPTDQIRRRRLAFRHEQSHHPQPPAVRRQALHSRHANPRQDILELYAAGQSSEQILVDFPDLEAEDLQAALAYAARQIDHPVLVG
jgi:hypothetical protein